MPKSEELINAEVLFKNWISGDKSQHSTRTTLSLLRRRMEFVTQEAVQEKARIYNSLPYETRTRTGWQNFKNENTTQFDREQEQIAEYLALISEATETEVITAPDIFTALMADGYVTPNLNGTYTPVKSLREVIRHILDDELADLSEGFIAKHFRKLDGSEYKNVSATLYQVRDEYRKPK